MLEQRNAQAYRILAMVSQDRQVHAVKRASLEYAGLLEGSAINKKWMSKVLGERPATGLSDTEIGIIGGVIIAALGVALSVGLFQMFSDDADPLDPEAPKKSMMEKAKDMVGGAAPDVATAVSVGITTSPLLGSEKMEAIQTGKPTDAVRASIKAGADKAGADSKLIYGLAGAESTFRTNVRNSDTGAQGVLQFTANTWNYLIKELKLDYTLDDRNDPEKAAYVAGLYVARITKTLTRLLGRKPSYGETYMGYFLGPTGASNFMAALQRDPKAIGAELFPRAAAANPNVFYKGGDRSQPMSLAQILAKLEGKVLSYAMEADGKTNVQPGSTLTAPPVTDAGTASATPVSATGTATATALPQQGVATATPTSPAVSLPTAEITNARQQAKRAMPEDTKNTSAAQSQKSTAAATSDRPPEASPHILRGTDGRLYKIS